jgi:hypothetical protein
MNNPLAGTDPTGYASETAEEKVAVTGSRIKRSASETTNSNGSITVGGSRVSSSFGVSSSNGAGNSGSEGNSGGKTTDINNQQKKAETTTTSNNEGWRDTINLSGSKSDVANASKELDELYSHDEFAKTIAEINAKFGGINVIIGSNDIIGLTDMGSKIPTIRIGTSTEYGYEASPEKLEALAATLNDGPQLNALETKIDSLYNNPMIQKFTLKRLLVHELGHVAMSPSRTGSNLRDSLKSVGHSSDGALIPKVNNFMFKHYGEIPRANHNKQYYGGRYDIK